MKTLILFACMVLLVSRALGVDAVTLDGQVFIRTKGGESIKLSLVDVLLFEQQAIDAHLENKRKATEPLLEELQPFAKEAEDKYERIKADEDRVRKRYFAAILDKQLEAEWHKASDAVIGAARAWDEARAATAYTRSAEYYFEGLPLVLQTTKTDADGKFSFQIPSGSYIAAALSTRHAGEKIEVYHWMIRTTVRTNQKLMLANDNLSTSGSADSAILTPENETVLLRPLKGIGVRGVASFLDTKKREKAAAQALEKQEKERLVKKAAADQQRQQEQQRQAQLAYYRQHPEAAQREAIKLFPELGVAGSPLNKEFVERMKRYRAEKQEFFAEPDWPIRLAKECKEAH